MAGTFKDKDRMVFCKKCEVRWNPDQDENGYKCWNCGESWYDTNRDSKRTYKMYPEKPKPTGPPVINGEPVDVRARGKAA